MDQHLLQCGERLKDYFEGFAYISRSWDDGFGEIKEQRIQRGWLSEIRAWRKIPPVFSLLIVLSLRNSSSHNRIEDGVGSQCGINC